MFPEPLYLSCASNADLANNFINFFGTKISKIRNKLESLFITVYAFH